MTDISPNQDSGILKEILREGTGEEKPGNGDNVTVHYVGTLEDGTEFDSSRGRNEKFDFDLGKGNIWLTMVLLLNDLNNPFVTVH